MIPPLAVLPVLFIVVGLGETSKIALIVIGIAPCIARDLALRVGELPKEQIIKAQTLGASSWQLDSPRGAAAIVATPHRFDATVDGFRVAVPDCRRGDRIH
jgi:ABC-type nitrate/sulfonate/bicarbonate transport system permease component